MLARRAAAFDRHLGHFGVYAVMCQIAQGTADGGRPRQVFLAANLHEHHRSSLTEQRHRIGKRARRAFVVCVRHPHVRDSPCRAGAFATLPRISVNLEK